MPTPQQLEIEPIAKQLPVRVDPQPTPMSLMHIALERGQVDQLQILQGMHFKQLERDAEIEFNLAMNAVQSELGRIAPDLSNPHTKSKYASYAALDRVLRPIYTKHGFSLSFDSGDSQPETVVAYCFVSHFSGHTRKYQSPAMPSDGKGAQGKDVMSRTHATGAAMSYAMRYLLKFIFNIAVGEDDTDGNGAQPTVRLPEREKEHQERCEYFKKCDDAEILKEHWMASRKWARENKDESAVNDYDFLKEQRKKDLSK